MPTAKLADADISLDKELDNGSLLGVNFAGAMATPWDYFQLLKPRVMSLVIFTAFVGIVISVPMQNVHPFLQIIGLLSIACGAGASGALNMWYDADIDCLMTRTQKRPIPAGRISPEAARDFGLWLSLLSVIMLALTANYLAASLLAFTIFFYVVIYTMWLKRLTPQNIVIGGLAGALPPVIGGAIMTGTVTLETLILCAIIFLWTPPHFWALALVKKEDYQAASIPMMPNIKGDRHTAFQGVIYSVILFFVSLLPIYLGFANIIYGVWALAMGLLYVISCGAIYRALGTDMLNVIAIKSFVLSIIYLFGLFCSLLIEHLFGVNFL